MHTTNLHTDRSLNETLHSKSLSDVSQ